MKKTKKSAKQKRVLIVAIIVAVAIIAGSTFAWLSSKDEVTNRLSASSDYNVAIAEDFQAPADWIPGQTINKDVSAVNTGSVDAFVRMWLGGTLRLLKEETPNINAASNSATNGLTQVTDEDLKNIGLTWSKDNVYYKTLSTDKIDNPNDAAHATAVDEQTNSTAKFSEVQEMQAGGVLVYAPANAAYHWTLEQATEMPVGTYSSNTITNLPKGTVVGTNNSAETGVKKIAGSSSTDQNYYGSIDASTFQPETTGLYLFRRNVGETADGTANTYEYSGYYFDKTKFDNGQPAYFALHNGTGANGHSDYVLPAGVINDNSTAVSSLDQVLPVTIADNQNVFLYTAAETLTQTDALTWTYDGTDKKFTVSNGAATNPISIDIALANIDSTASEAWTAIPDTTNPYKTTFYYNNDVEAGDTTVKLIDSVTLSGDTNKDAYLMFDFDLNVFMDSVQVTKDENGAESDLTVSDSTNGWAIASGDLDKAAKGDATVSGSEITKIAWTAI